MNAIINAVKSERTLNDLTETVHQALLPNGSYRALLYATYDEQAVEGSLAADDQEAARMIREKAQEMHLEELARQKLATIVKCLGVVLRRYRQSRKERRRQFSGDIVP